MTTVIHRYFEAVSERLRWHRRPPDRRHRRRRAGVRRLDRGRRPRVLVRHRPRRVRRARDVPAHRDDRRVPADRRAADRPDAPRLRRHGHASVPVPAQAGGVRQRDPARPPPRPWRHDDPVLAVRPQRRDPRHRRSSASSAASRSSASRRCHTPAASSRATRRASGSTRSPTSSSTPACRTPTPAWHSRGRDALFGPTSTPVAVVVAHGIVARTAEMSSVAATAEGDAQSQRHRLPSGQRQQRRGLRGPVAAACPPMTDRTAFRRRRVDRRVRPPSR